MKTRQKLAAAVCALAAVAGASVPQISCSFTAVLELHATYNGVKYVGNYTHYSIADTAWAQVGVVPMDYPGNSTTLFRPPNHYTIINPFFKRHVCATVPISTTMKCFQLDFDASQNQRRVKCPRDKTRLCDHWYFKDTAEEDNDYWIYSDTVDTNPVLDRVVVDGDNVHEQYDFLVFDPTEPPRSYLEIPKDQPCANLVDDDDDDDLELYVLDSHFAGRLRRTTQPHPNAKRKPGLADLAINGPEALGATQRLLSRAVAATGKKPLWTAAPSPRFDGMTYRDAAKTLLQPPRMRTAAAAPLQRARTADSNSKRAAPRVADKIPARFDSREQWPMCNIKAIRDQGSCGSCWAFGAAEAFSDRVCIMQNGTAPTTLSPEYLVSCYTNLDGCDGGYVDVAMEDLRDIGTVLEECLPYEGRSVACPTTVCADKKTPLRMYRMRDVYDVYVPFNDPLNVRAIQTEIMTRGPVETAFWVFADFMHYSGGIYTRTKGSALVGGHAVKIIGWGEENGTPYWTVANSWGTGWGERGFFRILRGTNECDIEDDVACGTPAL